MDTDQNKRAYEGTKHTLLTENKIGGEFVKTPNAKFIEERAKQWEIFYKAQEEKQKNLPHEKIKIILKDGKEVEGISNESTPYEIGKAHILFAESILRIIYVISPALPGEERSLIC